MRSRRVSWLSDLWSNPWASPSPALRHKFSPKNRLKQYTFTSSTRSQETVHAHRASLWAFLCAESCTYRGAAAVARGMALRAMGCSLMGVCKVFLRHVAPTRYGDQTLAAGEHLAPGFSQWRLALAAVLREPLCMYVQSEYTWSLWVTVTVTVTVYLF